VNAPTYAVRPRLAWASVMLAAAVAVVVAVEVRGVAARTTFARPAAFGDVRWAAVSDAAEAVRVWADAGLRGRKVLLLTGRWAQVQSMNTDVADAAAMPGASLGLLDANTAVLAAARTGVARELVIVMPPAAFARRLDEVKGAKELTRGDGWFTLPFHGYARRFSVPEALLAPREPVLALVEASFFDAGAPGALAAWLASRGIEVELGLVAMDDPTASPEQRERAAAFAQGTRAVAVEVSR
jgi:hypothetical protein